MSVVLNTCANEAITSKNKTKQKFNQSNGNGIYYYTSKVVNGL